VPKNCTQFNLIKKWTDKEGTEKYSVKPKINYATMYDVEKATIMVDELEKLGPIEARFVFTFSPAREYKKYYGIHMCAKQLQVRKKKSSGQVCWFD
jgi:hypothetical protein